MPVNRAVAMSDEELFQQRHEVVSNLLVDTALTERQRDIAAFLVLGVSRADLAQRLGIRRYTVESHLVAIYNKFAIHNTGELSGIITGRLVDRVVEQERSGSQPDLRMGRDFASKRAHGAPGVRQNRDLTKRPSVQNSSLLTH